MIFLKQDLLCRVGNKRGAGRRPFFQPREVCRDILQRAGVSVGCEQETSKNNPADNGPLNEPSSSPP